MNQFADALSGRECTVCGRVDNLQENRCRWCRAFENISRKLQNPQYTAFCITRDSSARDLTLPDRNGQDVSLLLLTEDEAAKQIAQDRQMVQVNLEIVLVNLHAVEETRALAGLSLIHI